MRLPLDVRRLRFNPEILVASLATNLFALALPLCMLHVFDRVIPNDGVATLTTFAAGLIVVACADFAIRTARSRLVLVAGARFEVATHRKALDRALNPGADLRQLEREDLFDRFTSIGRMRRHYVSELGMAVLDIPFIGIFLTVIALISPVMGLGAAALAMLSLAAVWLHRRIIIRLNHLRQERDLRRHSFLTETLEGIETIKSLGVEAQMQRRYERLMAGSAAITRELSGIISFTQGVTGTVAMVSPVVMASLGSVLVIDGQMTMGGLAAAVLLAARVIQPTLRIEALIAGERDVRPSVEAVRGLVDAPLSHTGTRPLFSIRELSLEGVSWAPADGAAPVLRRVSLTLRRGDCISIDGADGSGRSTLLGLLSGHLLPQEGTLCLDGAPLSDYDPADVAKRIAYLSADHTVLEGNLLENLTGFETGRHRDAALALARELEVDDFISKHPQGLGMRLSARTAGTLPKSIHDAAPLICGLVREPDVILFDEANRGFDHRSDAALIGLLQRLKRDRIIVLVTYRPSLRRLADRHFTIEDGQLCEAPLLLTAARATA